jgi:hypothetical protein
MISYKSIGHFGRLGNQMFQFASTYGIANKLGLDVSFPIENIHNPSVENFKDGITRDVYFDIPNTFNIPTTLLKPIDQIKTEYKVQEPYFHFSEDLFNIPDSSDLGGYYQSEKYFEHCQQDIRSLFTFKTNVIEEAETKLPKVNSELVSIHIRVGDYIGLQNYHPVCDAGYYSSAIKNFLDKDYYFLIFSDNIEYSKNIFQESENIIYFEGNTQEVDMCLMSMCDHNIIANSSFSWWAAWLNNNQNKKVVAPKKWFGPAYYFHNTKDLYIKNWIIE